MSRRTSIRRPCVEQWRKGPVFHWSRPPRYARAAWLCTASFAVSSRLSARRRKKRGRGSTSTVGIWEQHTARIIRAISASPVTLGNTTAWVNPARVGVDWHTLDSMLPLGSETESMFLSAHQAMFLRLLWEASRRTNGYKRRCLSCERTATVRSGYARRAQRRIARWQRT